MAKTLFTIVVKFRKAAGATPVSKNLTIHAENREAAQRMALQDREVQKAYEIISSK